jgi:hypothetical protein
MDVVHFGLVVVGQVAAARELGVQLADGELDIFGGDSGHGLGWFLGTFSKKVQHASNFFWILKMRRGSK